MDTMRSEYFMSVVENALDKIPAFVFGAMAGLSIALIIVWK